MNRIVTVVRISFIICFLFTLTNSIEAQAPKTSGSESQETNKTSNEESSTIEVTLRWFIQGDKITIEAFVDPNDVKSVKEESISKPQYNSILKQAVFDFITGKDQATEEALWTKIGVKSDENKSSTWKALVGYLARARRIDELKSDNRIIKLQPPINKLQEEIIELDKVITQLNEQIAEKEADSKEARLEKDGKENWQIISLILKAIDTVVIISVLGIIVYILTRRPLKKIREKSKELIETLGKSNECFENIEKVVRKLNDTFSKLPNKIDKKFRVLNLILKTEQTKIDKRFKRIESNKPQDEIDEKFKALIQELLDYQIKISDLETDLKEYIKAEIEQVRPFTTEEFDTKHNEIIQELENQKDTINKLEKKIEQTKKEVDQQIQRDVEDLCLRASDFQDKLKNKYDEWKDELEIFTEVLSTLKPQEDYSLPPFKAKKDLLQWQKQVEEMLETLSISTSDDTEQVENAHSQFLAERSNWEQQLNEMDNGLSTLQINWQEHAKILVSSLDIYKQNITSEDVNDLETRIKEFVEKVGLQLIEPEPGDQYNPKLHILQAERSFQNIPRGRIGETLVRGLQNEARVIQKAQIVISKGN